MGQFLLVRHLCFSLMLVAFGRGVEEGFVVVLEGFAGERLGLAPRKVMELY